MPSPRPTIDLGDFWTPWELHGSAHAAERLAATFRVMWPDQPLTARGSTPCAATVPCPASTFTHWTTWELRGNSRLANGLVSYHAECWPGEPLTVLHEGARDGR